MHSWLEVGLDRVKCRKSFMIANVLALAQSYSVRIIRVRRELEVSLATEKCHECVVIAAKVVILLGVSFERPLLGQREGPIQRGQ